MRVPGSTHLLQTGGRKPATHMALSLPVIVLVLAFTAVPLQLRPLSQERLRAVRHPTLDVTDIVANIAGYVPVGIVLASRGAWLAVGGAGAVSLFAEASQLFSTGRSPSLVDVATNVIGAVVGLVISIRWKPRWAIAPPEIALGRRQAAAAAALVVGYFGVAAWVTPRSAEEVVTGALADTRLAWLRVNPRGASAPGRLESRWSFDSSESRATPDASGNRLDGVLVGAPAPTAGIDRRALQLNGADQYADFGDPIALRLTGSMTISAWINASAFPVGDAAVVSSRGRFGYQLDTTAVQGPRTISFKLANAAGELMARYGRTRLEVHRWYHVAAVYDARALTLNVYLDGQPDDGCLLGTVTDRQRISGVNVYVGRRGGGEGSEFAGSIDDVRIHSRALTQDDIENDMRVTMSARSLPLPAAAPVNGPVPDPGRCENIPTPSGPADGRASGYLVAFGLLVAVACAGCWPTSSYRMPCLALSAAAGLLVLPYVASTLPVHSSWIIVPVLALVGGATAAVATRTL
jgi:VanZ family protein